MNCMTSFRMPSSGKCRVALFRDRFVRLLLIVDSALFDVLPSTLRLGEDMSMSTRVSECNSPPARLPARHLYRCV
jgi:hypothetical protein